VVRRQGAIPNRPITTKQRGKPLASLNTNVALQAYELAVSHFPVIQLINLGCPQ
jgi:hypothetical protein